MAELLISAFTTTDGRIAVFPAAFFETGFGLDAGFADLISDERLRLTGLHRL